jgi:hypothetical protein
MSCASATEKGISWSSIEPFCGQLTSAEPKEFPIKTAAITLYRAESKHLPCCDHAKSLGNVHIDSKGNFDLRKLPAGQYWLVVKWARVEVPVALWYEAKYQHACDETLKNVIEIKPSSKTAERTIITSNDSLDNAQTN